MRDLDCDPSKCAGPIDQRVADRLSKRYTLDQDFLAYLETCHGGEPSNKSISIDGRSYQLALFLTLFDFDSKLSGPFRPHFNHPEDERKIDSIVFLMEHEHMTSRCLFSDLVPFAATQIDSLLDRAAVDLFCFDYRVSTERPPVVIWQAKNAANAFFDWNDRPLEEQFDDEDRFINVPYGSFLIPVSRTFIDFIGALDCTK